MSATAPRRRVRRAFTAVVAGLALALGPVSLAVADPTPSPAETPASPAPTPSPPPTPTPSPSVATSPETSAATAPATATVLSASRARALLAGRVPAPVRRALGAWHPAGARRAAPDPLVGLVLGSCSAGPATGSIDLEIAVSPTATVRYLVNGPSGDRSGTITVPQDGVGEAVVDDLARGTYRVRLYEGDAAAPASDVTVDVLSCVTVEVSCQAATFTNPADNPALLVGYETDSDSDDGGGFTLQPGTRHTERIRLPEVEWFALDVAGLDPGTEDVATFATAGGDDIAIPQESCGSPFRTRITAGCSAGSAPADVALEVRHVQDDVRYELRRVPDDDEPGELVGSGMLGRPGTDTVATTLPGVGDYLWLAYLGDDPVPYETLEVSVLRCVTTTVSCQRVTFANPKGNPRVTVAWYVPGSGRRERFVEVRGGHRRALSVSSPQIGWDAVPTADLGAFQAGELDVASLAGRVDTLPVPVDCTVAGAGSGDDSDPVALADTGSSPWSAGVGLLGVLLVGAGAAAIRVGRRRTP